MFFVGEKHFVFAGLTVLKCYNYNKNVMRWSVDLRIRPEMLIDTKTKLKIAMFLTYNYTPMTTAEAARIVNLPVMTVLRAMNFFESAGMTVKRRVGTAVVWEVNRESYAYKTAASACGPLIDAKGPVEEIKKTIASALKGSGVLEAKLFGSVARGDFSDESDVDLYVLVKSDRDKKSFEKYEANMASSIAALTGKTLVVYVLTERERKEKAKLKVIKNIEKEGISII